MSTTAGITDAKMLKLPLIRNTNTMNSAPEPMMKTGNNLFLRATSLSRYIDHKPAIPNTIHVAVNQGAISGCGFMGMSGRLSHPVLSLRGKGEKSGLQVRT